MTVRSFSPKTLAASFASVTNRYVALLILYGAIILAGSSLSQPPQGPIHSDKAFHFVEYAIFAYFALQAVRAIQGSKSLPVVALMAACFACGFAAFDEFYQSFVPGRIPSLTDWMADVAGILGMITFMTLERRGTR